VDILKYDAMKVRKGGAKICGLAKEFLKRNVLGLCGLWCLWGPVHWSKLPGKSGIPWASGELVYAHI